MTAATGTTPVKTTGTAVASGLLQEKEGGNEDKDDTNLLAVPTSMLVRGPHTNR